MGESAIQSAIIKRLEKRGAYVARVITAGKAGTPDLICCEPMQITEDMVGSTVGAFFAVEVKTAVGRVSKLQEYHLGKIRKAGGTGEIIRSVGELDKLLDNLGAHA